MKIKGYNARRSHTIGYRSADPSRDKDIHGAPVTSEYAAFVQISDCEIKSEWSEKRQCNVNRYYADKAPAIPISYWGTYYGAGRPRLNNNGRWFYNRDTKEREWENKYITVPTYFCVDGRVYTATSRVPLKRASEFVIKQLSPKNQKIVRDYLEQEASLSKR